MQGPKGSWFSFRALPYRAPDNKIDGAMLMMLDIDVLKHSRNYVEAVVEAVRQPLVVPSTDLRISGANRTFYETLKVTKEEIENR